MASNLVPTKTGFINKGFAPAQRRNVVTGEIITIPPGATSEFSQAERDALNIQGASGGGNLLTGGNGILKNPVTGIVAGVATAGLADAALAGVEAGSAGAGGTAAGVGTATSMFGPGAAETLDASLAGTYSGNAAAATAGAAGGAAVGSQEATGAATTPGAPATPQMPPAVPEAGVGTSGTTLDTIKSLAPVVNAGASLLGAGVALGAGSPGMGDTQSPVAPDLPTTDTVNAQNAIDPDLSAIRKKNALLFGLDSPSSTDLTRGNADTGNLGRVTLLGGTSRLG